jgi:signal transduction histidine kinase/CheY-like chemotaxis protein
MNALENVKSLFPKHASLIESFASVHRGILIVLDEKEKIIGANDALLKFLDRETFKDIESDLTYEIVDNGGSVLDISQKKWAERHLKERGLILTLKHGHKQSAFNLMINRAVIDDSVIYLLLLEDDSSIQKAIQAHHYFETFKRKFLTSVSHEFRTPMNGILGFIKLLENSTLTKTQRHQVSMIDESATEMMHKIENLLEMMQLDSGAIVLKETVFKLVERFDEFFSKFYESARRKNIMLLSFIDPKIPHSMLGDPGKIKRVLESLVSNAIKFTDEGGQILIEIKVLGTNDGYVELEYSVIDSGAGIAKEKLAYILRPFASADENQKHGKHGLGIGLNVSHKYLEMMHSKLAVISEVGKGSKFFFRLKHKINEGSKFSNFADAKIAVVSFWAVDHLYANSVTNYLKEFGVTVIQTNQIIKEELEKVDTLFLITQDLKDERIKSMRTILGDDIKIVSVLTKPREKVSASNVKNILQTLEFPILPDKIENVLNLIYFNRTIESDKETKALQENKNVKILLAEDNFINLELLQTILTLQNYEVTAVENGELAVEAYMKEPYDLVLTDIDMPVMDGIVATRLIREIDRQKRRPKIPIIALTAYALEGDRERIIEAGLDAHIPKPVDKAYLLEVIKHFLKRQNDAKSAH